MHKSLCDSVLRLLREKCVGTKGAERRGCENFRIGEKRFKKKRGKKSRKIEKEKVYTTTTVKIVLNPCTGP